MQGNFVNKAFNLPLRPDEYHDIRAEIFHRLEKELPAHLTYHTAGHTKKVVELTGLLSEEEGLSDHEIQLLLIAAVFHDTGFLVSPIDHEEISVKIFREYDLPLEEEEKLKIDRYIRATRIGAPLTSREEYIITDADLFYLGTDGYLPISDQLRKEWENLGNHYTDKQWFDLQVRFMENHKFRTRSAQLLFGPKKSENLLFLKRSVQPQ